jgi:hypothetical protein
MVPSDTELHHPRATFCTISGLASGIAYGVSVTAFGVGPGHPELRAGRSTQGTPLPRDVGSGPIKS